MKFLRWIITSTFTTSAGLFTLGALFLLGYNVTHALTSYDVVNAPQMFLQDTISPGQTTGIKLASPKINGEEWRFATTTGGVLRIRSFLGSTREDIAFTSATIDSNNVVTLVGVTRQLCPQSTRTYVSCGDGYQWGRSSVVELNVDARLINLKLNSDRSNTGSGLFSIRSNQTTQPWLFPNRVTTTQRDAFTYGTSTSEAPIIFNTTTGTWQGWNGSSWVSFEDAGATVNATNAVRGVVQLATTGAMLNLTQIGSSGAANVVQLAHVIKNGSGSTSSGKVISTNNLGVVDKSLGGVGGRLPKSNSGVIALTTSGARLLLGTASGDFVRFNANRTPIATPYSPPVYEKVVYLSADTSSATGASMATTHYFDTHTFTIPANDLIAGVEYDFEAKISATATSTYTYAPCFRVGTGGSDRATGTITFSGGGTRVFLVTGRIIGTTTAGASSAVHGIMSGQSNQSATWFNPDYGSSNEATNGTLQISFCGTWGTSDAGNSATLTDVMITKRSSTPF